MCIRDRSEYQQFKEELENGKMIDCSWCGNQTCEDKIKRRLVQIYVLFHLATQKNQKHVFTVKIQALQMYYLLKATK